MLLTPLSGYLPLLVALFNHGLSLELPGFGGRIINGTKAIIEDHPYMAAIIKDNLVQCSGIIVTSSWVLTCAHCYKKKTENNIQNTKVVVGDENPQNPREGTRKYAITKLVLHPSYVETDLYYDIALLKTSEVFKFTQKVQPAQLAGANDKVPQPNTYCVAVGFGNAVSQILNKSET
jgi:secreted trypsin-like serine protease